MSDDDSCSCPSWFPQQCFPIHWVLHLLPEAKVWKACVVLKDGQSNYGKPLSYWTIHRIKRDRKTTSRESKRSKALLLRPWWIQRKKKWGSWFSTPSPTEFLAYRWSGHTTRVRRYTLHFFQYQQTWNHSIEMRDLTQGIEIAAYQTWQAVEDASIVRDLSVPSPHSSSAIGHRNIARP